MTILYCTVCQKEITNFSKYQIYRYKETGRIFCCKEHGKEYRVKALLSGSARSVATIKKKFPIKTHFCEVCGKSVQLVTSHQKDLFREKKIAYCSKECSDINKKKLLSEHMKKLCQQPDFQKIVKDRMQNNNPMRNTETVQKMIKTKNTNGTNVFKLRGGNGRPLPKEHQLLLDALQSLSILWIPECAVPTKQKRDSGYPTCYKIDIGRKDLKIGIEVDGTTHDAVTQKLLDKKKTEFLATLGWQVLRFKNQEIKEDLDGCVKKIMSMI